MELFRLLGTIAIDNQKANNELDFTTDKAEKSETRMTKAFKKIGAAVVAAFATDKIIGFGKACVDAAVSISAETAAFGQIMGDYSDKAQAKIKEVADATGIVDGRLTGYMTSMTAKFQGLGYDIDDATDLAQSGLMIAADAAAFWDKSMEDSMSSLNSFVNGNYEGGEAIGLFANETTLAAWAAENLGYEWQSLTEKEKQFARLEFAKAMQQTSGVTGQAANEADAYANVMGNLQRIWQEFQTTIGEPILNKVVLPAMLKLQKVLPVIGDHVQNLIDWFGEHETAVKNVATAIGLATGAMAAFKAGSKIQGIINAFQQAKVSLALYTATANGASIAQGVMNGTLTVGETIVALLTGKLTLAELATTMYAKAQAGLNAVMAANPISIVIVAITALIAIFVLLWNKCEGFREFWINLWEKVKEIAGIAIDWIKGKIEDFKLKVQIAFEFIKQYIVNPIKSAFDTVKSVFSGIYNTIKSWIDKAKNFVKGAIDAIKGFFNFKVDLPKIKLPHFSIKPKDWELGDLLKGKIPKLGIEWYAKGGVFDEPTIFPTASGFKGVGEAGAEAVAPISVLQNYVSDAVRTENTVLAGKFDELMELLAVMLQQVIDSNGHSITIDGSTLVGWLDKKMAQNQSLQLRGV